MWNLDKHRQIVKVIEKASLSWNRCPRLSQIDDQREIALQLSQKAQKDSVQLARLVATVLGLRHPERGTRGRREMF